jgi:hypothetical protein
VPTQAKDAAAHCSPSEPLVGGHPGLQYPWRRSSQVRILASGMRLTRREQRGRPERASACNGWAHADRTRTNASTVSGITAVPSGRLVTTVDLRSAWPPSTHLLPVKSEARRGLSTNRSEPVRGGAPARTRFLASPLSRPVAAWQELLQSHATAQTRQMLKKLLAAPLQAEPVREGGVRGWQVTAGGRSANCSPDWPLQIWWRPHRESNPSLGLERAAS